MTQMTERMEIAEKIEHAKHAHHDENGGADHGGMNKRIGVTMGLIAVLVAVCAAWVGAERNETTRALIQQTQVSNTIAAASTRYRTMMNEVEGLRREDPDSVTEAQKMRYISLALDYRKERRIASAWSKSYTPLIEAHFEATEGYEKAQVAAEIAIVAASISLLLSSRILWVLSVVIALGSGVQMGITYVHAEHHLTEAQAEIEKQKSALQLLRKKMGSDDSDTEALDALDPDGSRRKAIEAADEIRERTVQEKAKAQSTPPAAKSH
ncbi:hypothetical protein CCC_00310 [Paramagnetospirillum magnetotacticum MS-1]|uniref:Uncharacterized protein n=1 Tax=Paramagnetospirillum magnetotacticum MS-1 TaxID=272627 RepID=A0A0C2YBX4_PARME|nr:DUF4337 family protein [Paramagnetospirillum magnetotacticum]KIL97249.1 hypothetical protein CCC_00310 [Paramagnetospirillum magnetotacticum MS-1]